VAVAAAVRRTTRATDTLNAWAAQSPWSLYTTVQPTSDLQITPKAHGRQSRIFQLASITPTSKKRCNSLAFVADGFLAQAEKKQALA